MSCEGSSAVTFQLPIELVLGDLSSGWTMVHQGFILEQLAGEWEKILAGINPDDLFAPMPLPDA